MTHGSRVTHGQPASAGHLPARTRFGSARAYQRCWQPLWPAQHACPIATRISNPPSEPVRSAG